MPKQKGERKMIKRADPLMKQIEKDQNSKYAQERNHWKKKKKPKKLRNLSWPMLKKK